MARITTENLQQLFDQVAGYKKEIETAGNDKRNKFSSTNYDSVISTIPIDAGTNKVDPTNWDGKTEEDQQKIFQTLDQLYCSLKNIAGSDGPTNPNSIMFDEYASNSMIVIMVLIALLLNLFLLQQIRIRWNKSITTNDVRVKTEKASQALLDMKAASEKLIRYKARVFPVTDTTGTKKTVSDSARKISDRAIQDSLVFYARMEKQAGVKASTESIEAIRAMEGSADEKDVLFMVLLLGALGGTIHFLSSVVKFVGNRQFKRSWILYYFSMPVTGAGLALIVYMLLRIGILNPSGAAGTGTGISNLNLIAIYAFSVLSGLFSKIATEKLAEVFNTLFKTSDAKSKDSLDQDPKKAGD